MKIIQRSILGLKFPNITQVLCLTYLEFHEHTMLQMEITNFLHPQTVLFSYFPINLISLKFYKSQPPKLAVISSFSLFLTPTPINQSPTLDDFSFQSSSGWSSHIVI